MKINNSILYLLCALALLATEAFAFCPAPGPVNACGNPEFQSCTMPINGIPRQYCIHIPSAPVNQLPVVFAFHGGGGSGSVMVDIWDKHTEQGMVLVAPTALATSGSSGAPGCERKWRHLGRNIATWADFLLVDPCVVPGAPAGAPQISDLDFVRGLMQGINSNLNVSRFYATGFSSGAGMTYQLFNTKPFAERFSGFATISNTMNKQKKAAIAAGGGVAGYTANTDVRKPILFIMGTADKLNAPTPSISETAPSCTFLNTCTPLAGGTFDCTAVIDEGVGCWHSTVTAGNNKHRMNTPRADNIAWLTRFNGSHPNPLVGLYPNVGSQPAPQGGPVDQTAVVRQDFLAVKQGSAPVSVVTVLDGAHNVPGRNGDYPPCSSASCDIDATEVTLQFWRAHAGFRSQWP